MLQRHLATVLLAGTITGSAAPSWADAPLWESWSQPYPQRGEFAPSRQGTLQPRLQLATYSAPAPLSNPIQQGLLDLAHSLEGKSQWERAAPLGNNIANKTLMETVKRLLTWQDSLEPAALERQFDLVSVSSKADSKAQFTGYYTPVLQGSRTRTAQFNIPVYRTPPSNLRRLSHNEIAHGALTGKGLEVAWVNNAYLLYIAQVQGAARIYFTDGSVSTLDYASDNGREFKAISTYLAAKGYKIGALSHNNINRWLLDHPAILPDALLSNPRYIFFNETQESPQTASGHGVIPGHTIAVDSRYIPHGSVLLAELPRLDALGKRQGGTEWRILFAQDHGRAIKGNGRFDLYTGVGGDAESAAYSVTGLHRVFMLVRKPG
ncbi:MltA domain-containing protein [Thiothrix litoralis]|uniref:peptidoglycan lytic exotransglycosylase n=2 Tax=Thiothrix litoralis TaxID=2891210 RepID=A0ABX7WS53_9GAMM|nr:MltA domain-containing protein [Thiothrix litoralis]QTR45023.1 MltA domain-containing protein [Thiothrix litoralis]